MGNESLRNGKLKWKLWREDPRCYYCGIETIMEKRDGGGKLPDNAATIEHLYTRYELEQRKAHGNPRVLACNKCNHEKGAATTKAQPIEELWRRSGQLDRMIQEGRI